MKIQVTYQPAPQVTIIEVNDHMGALYEDMVNALQRNELDPQELTKDDREFLAKLEQVIRSRLGNPSKIFGYAEVKDDPMTKHVEGISMEEVAAKLGWPIEKLRAYLGISYGT